MGQHPRVTRPWQMISVDLCGPLPRSTSGYRYIFVVQDYFSKFVLLHPLRVASASACVKYLEEQVFLLFSVPQYLISDNGTQFKSRNFIRLCEHYKVKILNTTLYHPQANPVVRVNSTIKTMLTAYVSDIQRKWGEVLQQVGCAIRTQIHETIAATPYFINFGREHICNGETYNRPHFDCKETNVDKRPQEMQKLFDFVRKRLDSSHIRTKKRYDLRRRPRQYTVGDRVYHKSHVLSDAANYITSKLSPRYVGPFVIKRKLSPLAYELVNERGQSKGVYHPQDLKEHPSNETD